MIYDGERIELGYRIDLVVEGLVVVEIKRVEAVNPVHQAQLHIRLRGRRIGLLINFQVAHLRDGMKRMGMAMTGKNEGIPRCDPVASAVKRF